jgi:pilus assembly protein HofM
MAFHTWQIGLDIQNRQLCALAIQPHREGWKLCHWWQQRLPQDTLRNGVLQSSPELVAALTTWRKRLPQRYSLRVALPDHLILQRPLPMPTQLLPEPAMRRYVQAAARKLFPIEPEALALDYRADPASGQLCVTAARQAVVEQWYAPLHQAGLQPTVFELTTQAFNVTAKAARLPVNGVLVLRHETRWLWSDGAASHGTSELATLAELQQQLLPQGITIRLCDNRENALSAGAEPFSPFDLFHYKQPPMPEYASDFTLAAGLALRAEDR